MVATTRSRARRARSLSEMLPYDMIEVVTKNMADALEPRVAVALSGTCKELRVPILATLEKIKLREKHTKAKALCARLNDAWPVVVDAPTGRYSLDLSQVGNRIAPRPRSLSSLTSARAARRLKQR